MRPIQQPLTLFLIGATGDLAKKKILKALFTLHQDGLMPDRFTLIANSRKPFSRTEFQTFVREVVQPKDEVVWQKFADTLYYVSGDVDKIETFKKIQALHDSLPACGNHLWYIATLPSLYYQTTKNIKLVGLDHVKCGWSKIMLEKPFGTDIHTARELDKVLTGVFTEEEIYRIDHFLAKETVQNLLVFRFANGIFEHLWRKEFIDHIQITAAEDFGIEGREVFYEQTGTVRDVVQNHVLQMLAMVLMNEPQSLSAYDIRHQRQEVLNHLRPLDPKTLHTQSAFGQYAEGEIDGHKVRSYRQEKGIPADSKTETAVALRCFVDMPRWQDMPIYIRAGKRMQRTVVEISIQFKEPQNMMFKEAHLSEGGNVLTLRIQPNEGVVVRLKVKKPGLNLELEDVPMQFCYKSEFQMGLVEAYVKLIYDAVQGDSTLFTRSQGIESSWQFVQPLLNYKASPKFKVDPYQAGSFGPVSFDKLIQADGRNWIVPSIDVCNI